MIGFYSPSYRRVKKLEERWLAACIFLLASIVCFLLARSPLPSPFGAEAGNSLLYALLGAFASAAMVEILEWHGMREEVIDEAWRLTHKLYNYANDTNWLNPVRDFDRDPESVTALIEEIKIPHLLLHAPHCLDEYCARRYQNENATFDSLTDSEKAKVLDEIDSWLEKTKEPIQHYWTLKSTAEKIITLRDVFETRSFMCKRASEQFLEIIKLAEAIRDDTDLIQGETETERIHLRENGWDDECYNYAGVYKCEKVFGESDKQVFNGKAYELSKYQLELFSHIEKLMKIRCLYRPKDAEAKEPWPASVKEI